MLSVVSTLTTVNALKCYNEHLEEIDCSEQSSVSNSNVSRGASELANNPSDAELETCFKEIEIAGGTLLHIYGHSQARATACGCTALFDRFP